MSKGMNVSLQVATHDLLKTYASSIERSELT